MAIVGGGAGAGGEFSIGISADPSKVIEAFEALVEAASDAAKTIEEQFGQVSGSAEKVSGQFQAAGRTFQESLSGLALPDDLASDLNEVRGGIESVGEAGDAVSQRLERITRAAREADQEFDELSRTDALREQAEDADILDSSLRTALSQLGTFRSALGSLKGAFPIREVIPGPELQETIDTLRSSIQGLREEFSTPFPGGATRIVLDEIRELEAELSALERERQVSFLPEELEERATRIRERLRELRQEAQLVSRVPISVETSDAIAASQQLDRDLKTIVATITDIQQASARGLLDTTTAQEQIDALKRKQEELLAVIERPLTIGETLTRDLDAVSESARRLGEEVLNARLRFGEFIPQEASFQVSKLITDFERLSQVISQPIEFTALLEGVRSADDLIAVLDRLRTTAEGIARVELLSPGTIDNAQGLLENLGDSIDQVTERLVRFFPTEAADVARDVIAEIQAALDSLTTSRGDIIDPANTAEAERLTAEMEKWEDILNSIEGRRIELPVSSGIEDLQSRVEQFKQFQSQIDELSGVAGEDAAQAVRDLKEAQNQLGVSMKEATAATNAEAAALVASGKEVRKLKAEYDLLLATMEETPQRAAALASIKDQASGLGADLDLFAGKGRKAVESMNFMERAGARVDGALKGFGLTMRDLNVIIGSGFLSTAGPALAVLLGVKIVQAAVKATLAVTQLADVLRTSLEEVRAVFGESSAGIEEFASRSAAAFGTTEQAALSFAAKAGRVFESIGVGADSAAELTEGLLGAAEILRRTTGEFISSEEALQAVNDLVAGNIEGLRKLGIRLTESGLRSIEAADRLHGLGGTLDDTERGILSTIAALEAARDRFADARKQPESLAEAFERFRAIATQLGTEIGKELLPAIDFIAKSFIGFMALLLSAIKGIKEFARNNEALVDGLRKAAQFIVNMHPGLKLLVELLRVFNKAGQEAEGAAFDETLKDINEAIDESVDAFNNRKKSVSEELEETKKLVDAYENLSDVIEDNAKRLKDAREAVKEARIAGREEVQEALEELDEARVEGAKDIIAAEKDLKEAQEDRVKAIRDAQENLREAQEDRQEAISDARKALREAEKEAQKQVEDAEEALRDARIDAAKRVDDAEKRLADARRQRTQQLFDAQLSLEQALRRGDVFAQRQAQLALSRARQGRAVQDAKIALEEARLEASERIAEAQEKLAEAVEAASERVEDARDKLADTIEEQNKRVRDAAERLADTIEEQDERVAESAERLAEVREKVKDRILNAQKKLDDAEKKAIERLEEAKEKLREVRDENDRRLREARERVLELEGAWHDTNEELAHYRRQLAALKAQLGDFTISEDGTIVPDDYFRNRRRQHGGPMYPGNAYWTGEAGPELVIPGRASTVVSNDQVLRVLREMMEGRGASRPSIGQLVVQEVAGDPEATAQAIAVRLMRGLN